MVSNTYNKLKMPIALSNIYYNNRFYIFSKNQRLFFKKFNHKYRLFHSIQVINKFGTSVISSIKRFGLFLKDSFFYLNPVLLLLVFRLSSGVTLEKYQTLVSYYKVSKLISTKYADNCSNNYRYLNNILLSLVLCFYKCYYILVSSTYNYIRGL